MSKCPECQADVPNDAARCPACDCTFEPVVEGYSLGPLTRLRDGKYTIGRKIGQGGFGITYLGSKVQNGNRVAIKEFFLHGCYREGATVRATAHITEKDFEIIREKFINESRMLARFRHDGIVKVEDVFEENNTAYMVMEYLDGQNLHDILDEKGCVPENEVLRYVRQIADALDHIHKGKVLHRDIKPENIIVTGAGRVVLLDFGSAREFAANQTHSMTTWLTPGYAPIEQYSKRGKFSPSTDIYALGATMYHLLTGIIPDQSTDRMIQDSLVPPDYKNPDISRQTSEAVMWALQLDAYLRPKNASQFMQALDGKIKPPKVEVDSYGYGRHSKKGYGKSRSPRVRTGAGDNARQRDLGLAIILVATAMILAILFGYLKSLPAPSRINEYRNPYGNVWLVARAYDPETHNYAIKPIEQIHSIEIMETHRRRR